MSAVRTRLLPALVLCAALLVLVPAAIAADAGLIAFQGNRRDLNNGSVEKGIYTMAPNGSNVKRLGDGLEPAISRDGKTIAFVRTVAPPKGNEIPDIEIYTMNANGGDVTRVTRDGSTNTEPAFSADGKRIVFVGERGIKGKSNERPHLFVVDVDGSNERQLTRGASVDVEPAFSPDGKRIVFVRGPGESRLMSMSDDGQDVEALTDTRDPFSTPKAPSYSPNGQRVIFYAPENGKNRIFTIDADTGKNRITLTKGDDEGLEPAYSPEGGTIVFRRSVNLFAMSADGTGVDQLTNFEPQDGSNIHPSWGR